MFDTEEEEIDVVSVSEKYTAASRMNYALPTNPSMSDRRHLQKTMESAMGTRRPNNNNGLKIILPTKRTASSVPSSPPTKRKAAPINDSRGAKRAKQYRITNPTPYRRRGNYGHDSESEPEPSEKRSLHNNMERQRRIDLRNAFEYLRQLVPEVLKKERAAKVVILREAAKYCDQLTYNSMSLNRQVEDLKRHQEILRMRVSMLRRNLALKR
ncbi:hypothetical protein HHI36_019220 [Cryptolaemus montrouzieri]|uniref:BHLH domain-containing protein n=1 Tax=Cryptolaemus montrouzieri TaxID=559131 RepID=A0ABD2P2G9_9CUCU